MGACTCCVRSLREVSINVGQEWAVYGCMYMLREVSINVGQAVASQLGRDHVLTMGMQGRGERPSKFQV